MDRSPDAYGPTRVWGQLTVRPAYVLTLSD